MSVRKIFLALIVAIAAPPLMARGAEVDAEGLAFFEKEVRPILVEHCYECHSAEAEKLRGGLFLDSRDGWQRGGESGAALVAHDPDASLMIRAVGYEDDDLEMPPRKKLADDQIAVLRKWIVMGAPDPRATEPGGTAEKEGGIDLVEGRKFWSFQPLKKKTVPEVADGDWPVNAIDRFVLAKLEANGLQPAGNAPHETLLRRLFIDLTGLPPTLAEIEKYRAAEVTKIVDELLASPRFGERWGRHWLDLARYADSTGSGASRLLPEAWKYRDWVIRSFNEDLPFDEFVRRQLAGDLLAADDIEQRYDQLVATGFLVLGPRNYINDDEEAFHMDGADEQLDAVGRVFLGLSIGCARCHDHKFDPIPMDDYYALAGIFTSTETAAGIPATTNFEWNLQSDPRVDRDGSKLRDYESANAKYRVLNRAHSKAKSNPDISKKQLAEMDEERLAAKERVPQKPVTLMAASESVEVGDESLRIRGNPHQPADPVPRGFLRVLLPAGTGQHELLPKKESGRRELAEWIVSDENSLTSRVYVNRVWAHLMGRGLVISVDNFGVTGEQPSHPELLDWLAQWFEDNGHSTKELVKLIATSRVYRLGEASASDSGLMAGDNDNRLLGRRLRRSVDAETLRDAILRVSGVLNLSSVDKFGQAGEAFPRKLKNELEYDFGSDFRRSVHVPRFRNHLPEILEIFDVANPATVVGQRDRTILSPQALFWMNSEFVREHSGKAAAAIVEEGLPTEDAVRKMYRKTLTREPSDVELSLLVDFIDKPLAAREDEKAERLRRWSDAQQSIFASVDFRFY